jgi:hypothetical protein
MTTTVITETVREEHPGAFGDELTEDLRDQLVLDFARACRELTEAQLRQAAKDTPGHRSAVAEGRAGVDALLDMYLELYPATGRTP